MSRRLPFLLRCALFCGAGLLAATAQARMESLDDDQLSDVVGQAFINLTTDAANGLNFTRINFGADIETQLNMKKLQLGQYNRSGELAGSADIAIDNFALGTVNDTTGAINPFLISNPYIEFAYDGSKMVGIRIGFGEARATSRAISKPSPATCRWTCTAPAASWEAAFPAACWPSTAWRRRPPSLSPAALSTPPRQNW